MSHKLGICIPYRNRESHLNELLPKLDKHLNKQGIEYCVYVGHQVDDKLFNRGAMKNIAAVKAMEDGCDYVAFHDVICYLMMRHVTIHTPITPQHILLQNYQNTHGLWVMNNILEVSYFSIKNI